MIDIPLKDNRQESFCQWMARVSAVTQTQAYVNAGYLSKNPTQGATQIMRYSYIKIRIAQIKTLRDRKVVVTPQSVAIEADDNCQLALAMGDIKAANAALVIKAKAYGCQTDKTVTELTDAQQARTATERKEDKAYAKWRLTQPQEASNDDMADTDKVELDSQETAGTEQQQGNETAGVRHETEPSDSQSE